MILAEENFIKGKYTTKYIEEIKPQEKVSKMEGEEAFMIKAVSAEANLRGELG